MDSQNYLMVAVGLSVLLYAVVTHLTWAYRRRQAALPALRPRGSYPPEFWVEQIGRLVYYIGLPYVMLREGIGSARMMGLTGWSASSAIPLTIVVVLAAFFLLSIFWRRCISSLPALGDSLEGRLVSVSPRAAVTLEVIYLGVHWAFYRSAFIFWFGGDYYAGSFLGLLLVIAERLTNPEVRFALRHSELAVFEVSQWGLALCVTTAFFFSRSLAFVIGLQWLLAMGTFPAGQALIRKCLASAPASSTASSESR